MRRYVTTFGLFAVLAASAAMNQDGCQGVSLPDFKRPDPPIVPQTAAGDTLTRTFTVDLRDYPEAQSLTWDFGDGSVRAMQAVGGAKTVTHTFKGNGTFKIAVHLFSAQNPMTLEIRHLAKGELPVTVTGPNESPTAAFISRNATNASGGVQPRTVEFDATTSSDSDGNITRFDWDFGDGATTNAGAIVRHTYAVSGRYVVMLTVTDDRGATASISHQATANVLPTADFSFSSPSGAPQTVNFIATGSTDSDGQITSFKWSFGDNSAEGSGQTVQHVYASPGEFNVTLTVTDDLGGTATRTRMVDATGTDPFISSVDTRFGEVDTMPLITINGFNFSENSTARLVSPSAADIVATSVNFVSARQLTARFDLTGAPHGARSLVVTDSAARSTTLADAVQIVSADRVRLVTNQGDIVLSLDKNEAPNTVSNFMQYVGDGFYDNTVFHRVVNTPTPFVVQGGAFVSLGESASPRLREKAPRDAIRSEAPNNLSNTRGTVAMALRGSDANSATSQFFINLSDDNTFLDNGTPPFTVFGRVIEGMNVVDAIAAVRTGTFTVTTIDDNGRETPQSFDNIPIMDVTIIEARRE